MQSESVEAITSLIGPVGRSIVNMFDQMEVAEGEIDAADLKEMSRLEGCRLFLCMTPSSILRRVPLEAYRDHCRELCQRVKDQKPLQLATNIEVIVLMMDQALKAPLTSEARDILKMASEHTIFAEFWTYNTDGLNDYGYGEQHTRDELTGIKSKARQPDRRLWEKKG